MKDTVRTIKKSAIIFISIILFTTLCVTLYIGLEWATKSIPESLQDTMEAANLYDIRMLYTRGLSEADLQKISETDGVDEVVGSRLGYGTFVLNGNQYIQARIIEINDSVNVPQNVEGKLPETKGEAAVSKKWADDNGVKIGDTLPFITEKMGFGSLAQNELTITAFMDTVEYNELNVPGYGVSELNQLSVGCILYVSEEAFNPFVFRGNNLILIRSDRLRGLSTFSDEYKKETEIIKNNITEALADTDLSGFILTDRTYLPTTVVPTSLAGSLNSVKSILVSVFLIIGLLICYGSIIRMVSDQTYLIGTKMAMGISTGKIRLQYCLYTESAIILGCVAGGFLGRLVADILLGVCSGNYAIPFVCKMDYAPVLFICLFEIILALLVTLLGVEFTLKKKIVDLLTGNKAISAKKHFYERFPLWQKLSHFMRAVINNFVGEKKRVFQTMIGIIGSTTLIMISLIIYYDVNQSFDIQFSDYFHFDSYIYYDGTDAASEQIASVLDERNIPYANVFHTRKYMTKPDGLIGHTHVVAFDDEDSFKKMVTIVPETQNEGGRAYQGLWMSSGYWNYFGDENSEVIRFMSKDGYTELPVDGFFSYYLTSYQLFMDSETYEKYMGEPAVNNAFIISLSGNDRDDLLDALIKIPGYRMFTDYYDQSYHNFGTFKGIANMLVIVYFILAIVLSFMVSLSVLNMYVNEKKRELITMMINAYSPGKVKLYIFLDTAFITFTGILIGLIIGGFMGIQSVSALESDVVNFIHRIPAGLFVLSAAAVSFIMAMLSLIVQKRIGKFKLQDINEVI